MIRKQRWVISLGYWISTFCEGTGIIVIPLYLASLGISTSKIGITFVVYELAGILTNFFAGYFIRKVGYRKAFLCSLALHSLASFGYITLNPTLDLGLILIILSLLRAIRSIAIELIRTTSSSYFKQFTKSHRQSRFIAVQNLQGGKDLIKGVGLLTGGVLLAHVGFNNTFLILGIGTFLSLILAIFALGDFREQSNGARNGFFHVKNSMKLLAIIRMCIYFARDVWIIVPVPIYLLSMGISHVKIASGLAFSLILFGLMQPIMGRWTKTQLAIKSWELKSTWRYKDLIPLPTLLLLVIPTTLMFIPLKPEWLMISVVLYHVVNGITTTPHNYLHLKFARRTRSSMDIAFYKTISQMGKVGAVLASGYMYEYYGIKGCIGMSVGALVIALGFGLALARKTPASPTTLGQEP